MERSDSSDEDGGMEGRVVDNTENRFALDLVFVKILLPALRVYVMERLEAFYREYPLLGKPGGYRQFENDPVKKNVELIHPVVMYGKDDLLPNFHEFAKLYFEKPYFENLLKCGDIRVFLVLVTKAGCFNGSQASLAYKLKNWRDALAHQELIPDKMKLEVFDSVTQILQTIPNTGEQVKAVERARVGGVRRFLKLKRKSMAEQRVPTEPPTQVGTKHGCQKNQNSTPAPFQELMLFDGNEKGKYTFFKNTHLLTAFSVNLVCLLLSIASLATGNVSTVPEMHEIAMEISEEPEVGMDTKEDENKAEKKENNKPTYDKASNTWISTMTKRQRRGSQEKETTKPVVVIKVEERRSPRTTAAKYSAAQYGFHFNCWDPSPDPRFHPDSQIMIGPIPGSLEHEGIYLGLRTIFEAMGRVRFMFVHKNSTKEKRTLKVVKFGYVVFEEKCTAQRLLREGSVKLVKLDVTIPLTLMNRSRSRSLT